MRSVADSPKSGSDVLLVPAWLIIAVALGLFAVQLLMGTDPAFACFVLLFVLLSGVTTNIAGGLRSVSGLLIALCAFKIVILSQFLKIGFGQPAHTNMRAPHESILIMLVAMVGMLTVAVMLRVLPLPRRGLLKPVFAPHMLLKLALISLAISITAFAINRLGEGSYGGIFAIARFVLQPASVLAVIAATAHAIVSSGRRRSLNLLTVAVLVVMTGQGVLTFSKQAVLEPLLVYFVTCLGFRYRPNLLQAAVAAVFLAIGIQIIGPVVTAVRVPGLTVAERVDLVVDTIEDLLAGDRILREHDYWTRDFTYEVMLTPYYGESQSILDRYTLMHVDFVAHGVKSVGHLGWRTLEHGFKMLMPRFLYPEKPELPSQPLIRFHIDRRAIYNPTQFAFPLFADGYVSFGYLGTYLFTVIFVGILLVQIRFLSDRLTDNIWAVLLLMMFHHPFAEANANIYMLMSTHTMMVVLAFIFGVKWLARYKFGLFKTVRKPALSSPSPPASPERLPSAMRWHSAGE